MGAFTDAGKAIMLDALVPDAVSLHSADPGTIGDNELSGGSPAYARQTPSFNAASGGSRDLAADLTFDVPAGATVAYVGYWQGTTFLGSDAVTAETYAAQGTYKVLAAGTSLSV